MKKVLLVSDGIFHPPFFGRVVLHRMLKKMVGYSFEHTRSLEKVPKNLSDYLAMVIYIHHGTISDSAIKTFDAYVSSGGGALAIHSATASAKGNDTFTDILGGKFIGHGPVEPFLVTPVISESEIFGEIKEFQVTDELYIHELQPDIETHFTTVYDGQAVPIVWTRKHGEGRICYSCPGHRTATLQNKTYQSLLQQGLEWVIKA